MIKRLSSLNLTLWALGAVAALLLVGIVLAQLPPFSLAMAAMNKGLVLDWLLAAGAASGSACVAAWFIGLCCAVGVLVLNLCACTYSRLWPRVRGAKKAHNVLLFLAHGLMIVILLGHLSQMTMGYKDEAINMLPGQEIALPDGRRLVLEELSYVDDPAILNLTYRQARRVQTTTGFDRRRNQAVLSLWRGDELLSRGDLRILEPMIGHGVRLTLSDFYRDDAGGTVGAIIAVSMNPLTNMFFLAYISWIVVYVLLAATGSKNIEAWSAPKEGVA